MALNALAITKTTDYQGQVEEFDNVYYYEGPAFQLGDANYQRLVDTVVAAEKTVHSTDVNFKAARIWSAGGSVVENVTLGLYDLTGTGGLSATNPMHAEAAVVVSWECDRVNVLGRKVYLRKFLRMQHLGAGDALQARGKTAFGTAVSSFIKAYADKVDTVDTQGALFVLTSPSSRPRRAENNAVVSPYVVTREFRRN